MTIYLKIDAIGNVSQLLSHDEEEIIQEYIRRTDVTVVRVTAEGAESLDQYGD